MNPTIISSKNNELYKRIKSYQFAKNRKRDDCLIAEGLKTYNEALSTCELMTTVLSSSFAARHGSGFERSIVVSDALFCSLSELKTDQGILGVFRKPQWNLDLTCDSLSSLIVLKGIQDPLNLGAIIRSAHAFGFDAALLGSGCAQAYSPKTIRSSMGSVFHLPTITVNDDSLIPRLKQNGYSLIATDMSGQSDIKVPDRYALVIGNEGAGLDQGFLDECDLIFGIDMPGNAESLNAAVAAGIAMFALRQ